MSNTPSANLIDVRKFIDQQNVSAYQWLILALCFLVVALDGFDTAAIGFIAPALRTDWGLTPAALSPVLVAALLGLTLGAFCSGPLADRFGRKRILMMSTLVFGVFSLASAWSNSVPSLTILRFLTGVGLGGAMPNAVTLMSEFCPQRRRSVLVTTMFCGFTLGSALGGIVSAHVVPAYGWRMLLIIGGVLPLLVVPLLGLWLPESARFLLLKGGSDRRVTDILTRIAPLPAGAAGFQIDREEATEASSSPVRLIFLPGRRAGTVLLWLAFFMSMLIIYLLTNWLPLILKDTGRDLSQAALLTALFQVGGTIGAILLGYWMDRGNAYRVLSVTYFAGALCILAIAFAYANFTILALLVVGIGFCISGAQVGANALAAGFYPTASRATGVAWALGAGRVGSIFGSLIGGALVGQGWGIHGIFLMLTIPALLAAIVVFIMGGQYAGVDQDQEARA